MRRYLVSVTFAAVLPGCWHLVQVPLPHGEGLEVRVFAGGRAVADCQFLPDSKEHQALAVWLAQNTGGWHATPANFAPGVLVSASGLRINFLGERVILNYAGGQFSHPIKPNEYQFLMCGERVKSDVLDE